MKIADLFATIGFKIDSIKLREVSKIIGDLNFGSILSATSLAALGDGIAKLVHAADEASQQMLNFQEATAIDPSKAHQLDVYFQSFGAGAGEATAALHKLNQIRLQVLQGGNAQPFILTGLSPTTETLKLLDQIHDRFQDTHFLEQWAGKFAPAAKSLNEMKAAWKEMIAGQFGFSSDMLRGLDSSKEDWKTISGILALTTDEAKDNADAHRRWVLAMNDLNIQFEKLGTELAPILTESLKIVDAFVKIFGPHPEVKAAFDKGTARTPGAHRIADSDSAKESKRLNDWWHESIHAMDNFKPQEGQSGRRSGPATVTVTTGPITVNAKDPQDFVHKFDAVWKREMMKDLQFGQQT